MSDPVIGFIGFGEAAYLISQGLLNEGIKNVYAFDVLANDTKLGHTILKRANELKVGLMPSLEELIKACDIIFCATSAKVAESIAEESKRYLTSQHIYVDLNAASPMVKERISSLIEQSNARFVDGAVMESVPLKKHKVPIYLSGNGSIAFQKIGSKYGMNLTYINEAAGSSSAIKMFRSIFMKGFTMLLIETLQASHKYGVTDLIMNSISDSLSNQTLDETANMLITRTAVHAQRRVSEMDEVIKTLDTLNVDSLLSNAVKVKLQKIVDLKVKEILNSTVPENYVEVLEILNQLA